MHAAAPTAKASKDNDNCRKKLSLNITEEGYLDDGDDDAAAAAAAAVVHWRGWELGAWRGVMKGINWRRVIVQLSMIFKDETMPLSNRDLQSQRITSDKCL